MGLAAFNRSRRAAAEAARRAEAAAREATARAEQEQTVAGESLADLRRRAEELGVKNAARMGERRLTEEIAAAEAALADQKAQSELQALIERSIDLGIETDGKDAATLQAEIATKAAGPNGGASDADNGG